MAKKAPQAFRTISEVSDWLDTPTHVLRFWESKFSQVKPVKRAGGRRYYRPSDMELLGGIKVLLHDEGQTIKSVQEMLKEHGAGHVTKHSPELVFETRSRRRRKKASTAEKPSGAATQTNAETASTQSNQSEDQKPVSNSEQQDAVIKREDTSKPEPAAASSEPVAKPQSEKPTKQDELRSPVDASVSTREEADTKKPPQTINGGAAVTENQTEAESQQRTENEKPLEEPVKSEAKIDDNVENSRSTEEDARSVIAAAVSQRKARENQTAEATALEDKPLTPKPTGPSGTASMKKFAVKKAQKELNDSELALVEDLYYQLRKVRNRIRRSLDT